MAKFLCLFLQDLPDRLLISSNEKKPASAGIFFKTETLTLKQSNVDNAMSE